MVGFELGAVGVVVQDFGAEKLVELAEIVETGSMPESVDIAQARVEKLSEYYIVAAWADWWWVAA